MESYDNLLAESYIKILNRFPDELAYKVYIPLLKKRGTTFIENILVRSPEYKLKQRDGIFDKFIEKTIDKVLSKTFILPLTSNKSAVICEGREHCNIQYIVKEVLYFLDRSWILIIVCTDKNIQYIKNELKDIQNIKYNIVDKLDNFIDYNNLLLTQEFWNALQVEKVLIFQTDSILCKSGIEKFLKYDYIGAPSPDFTTMNGGISIRTTTKMVECLRKFSPTKYEAEDTFFTRTLKEIDSYLPNFNEAKVFSIEHVYHDYPYAIHKAWRFLDIDNVLDNVVL